MTRTPKRYWEVLKAKAVLVRGLWRLTMAQLVTKQDLSRDMVER